MKHNTYNMSYILTQRVLVSTWFDVQYKCYELNKSQGLNQFLYGGGEDLYSVIDEIFNQVAVKHKY